MFDITISEAAAICGGSVYGAGDPEQEIKEVCIDSRSVTPGAIFAAYRGEKTDGHRYVPAAFARGAICALCEELPQGEEHGMILLVDSVQEAMEKLMAAFRSRLKIPLLGIVGSVGKTTAKEMVSSVLEQRFSLYKTEGNLNNLIGVPVSLSRIRKEHEFGVLEMGINHFGEMRRLGKMVRPDIVLFTNIGHAHLEFLGDLEGVRRAKTEVLESMSEDALLLLNGDDEMLTSLTCSQRKIYYGLGENCAVRASRICRMQNDFMQCTISYEDRSFPVRIPGFGEHLVYAALEGAAAGFALGLTDGEIMRGIENYRPCGRRFACVDTGCFRLIDDCYNSNPDSLSSSLRSLALLPGRKVAILGDMLELGEHTDQMHRDMGALAKSLGIELLIAVGPLAKYMAEAYGSGAAWFESKDALLSSVFDLVHEKDAVLVKASRGVMLEEVSEAIKSYRKEP